MENLEKDLLNSTKRLFINEKERLKLVKITFILIAISIGILDTFAGRHYMNPDGVSYLDLADSFSAGNIREGINGHWSPLYPWILGVVLGMVKPPSFWEATIVHVINLGIYLAALVGFVYFWTTLYTWQKARNIQSERDFLTIPEWVWWALGFNLFLWAALDFISIRQVTPDMLVLVLILLAAGLILQINLGHSNWLIFATLGLVLGLGYLAKAPMFAIGLVFLVVSAFAAGNKSRILPKTLIAVIVFALIAGPLIIAFSLSKGSLTFGESGKLNYAWHVNGEKAYVHWQGGGDGRVGQPIHPTRLINENPAIYEFASPISGTYPPWYDPTYWHEGVKPKFVLKDQLAVLFDSSKQYFEIFVREQAGLLLALMILIMASKRNWLILKDIGSLWPILIPAVAALIMYAIVHVELRYLAPFILLIWAAAFSAIRLSRTEQSRQLVIYVILSVVILMMANHAALAVEIARKSDSLSDFLDYHTHEQWQIAEDLKQIGLEEGDRVAFIGYSMDAYWARLAGVQIVSDIFEQKEPYHDPYDVEFFWTTDPETREQATKAIEKTGAAIIVADDFPASGNIEGWKQLGSSGYYVFHFN